MSIERIPHDLASCSGPQKYSIPQGCPEWYEAAEVVARNRWRLLGEWPDWAPGGKVKPDAPIWFKMAPRTMRIRKGISTKLRRQILTDQEGKCADCDIEEWKLPARFHAHRLNPGKYGGRYVRGNVVLLCPQCHAQADSHKGSRALTYEERKQHGLGIS